MILEEETFETFGHYPSELPLGSRKHIYTACDNCGKVRISHRKDATSPLCLPCALDALKDSGCRQHHKMCRFEVFYFAFLSGATPWGTVVCELQKEAKQGNPYALNIWRSIDKNRYTSPVHTAVEVYLSSFTLASEKRGAQTK